MASYQYIYVMQNLTKVLPGGRELFKNITLSFFPGAKIGVLGVNGAGKSTLLKIMAGVDKEFNGEAWAADGVKVGYLEQEPKLDPSKGEMDVIYTMFPTGEGEKRVYHISIATLDKDDTIVRLLKTMTLEDVLTTIFNQSEK